MTPAQLADAVRTVPFGDLGRSRLWLADAARIVLANGLGLLGVTAPDRIEP